MPVVFLVIALLSVPGFSFEAWGEDVVGIRPLQSIKPGFIQSAIPQDSKLLNDPHAIERFLDEIDGSPPDWATVYGHGHHDPGHDDRLFNLNRARDAGREGNPSLQKRVTFIWFGELSQHDAQSGGFQVSLGPRFISTRWGIVRFKYEDLPSNLMAVPSGALARAIRRKMEKKQKVEIEVAVTGRLIPNESLVYDFSHDQDGLGLIMPVVRVEQVDYFIASKP